MESNAVPALTFPHPELTSIEGVPDFASLQQMKCQLFANACAIHSTRGDGTLGHAALVLGAQGCDAVANAGLAAGAVLHHWVAPIHPGAQPVMAFAKVPTPFGASLWTTPKRRRTPPMRHVRLFFLLPRSRNTSLHSIMLPSE